MPSKTDDELLAAQNSLFSPNQLMTVGQVCKEYGIGKTTLYGALADRQLRGKVVGKRGTRILRREVDAWIESLPDYQA